MNTPEHTPSPITLGIEMSNPSSTSADSPAHAIALWSGSNHDAPLLDSSPMPKGTRGSDGVMRAIELICECNGVRPGSIARILVSVGPGGYTALRIATTTAKMLAHTLGAEVIPVPSALVASTALTPGMCPALITLASKKGKTHASIATEPGTVNEIGVLGADSLESLGLGSIVADTHLPETFAQQAQALGLDRHELVLDARNLLRASQGIEPIESMRLTPLYAREPDAVTQWRARGSR